MRIALIHPPASFNLGNDFFSKGAEISIREVLGNQADIQRVEFLDSSSNHFEKYRWNFRRARPHGGRSPHFTNATYSWLCSWPDIVVLAGGGCLDPALENLFRVLNSLEKPLLYWQVSASSFGVADLHLTRRLLEEKNTIGIITRDPILPRLVGNHTKLISGIDGAFWLRGAMQDPHRQLPYSVINLENKGRFDVSSANAFLKSNREMVKGDVYFATNNSDFHDFYRHRNSLLITGWEQLFDLYKNASFVVTTRAHTAIASMSSGTPLLYKGKFDNRVVGLFQAVDKRITERIDSLKVGENELVGKIETAKEQFIESLRIFLNSRL